MFNLQPTPPPPLHSLILQSILQHLGHGYGYGVANHSPYGLVGGGVAPIGPQPPVAIGPATRPAPGPVQPPQTGPVAVRPAPGPYQPPNTSPYGIQGGGLHRLISGLLL